MGTAIAGRRTAGDAAQQDEARGEHCSRVAGGHDGVGLAVGDRLHRPDERAVLLGAERIRGLLVHADDLRRGHERRGRGIEPAEPKMTGSIRRRARRARPRRRLGPAISAHRVDGYAGHGGTLRSVVRSGSTSRPLYVPQVGQTRCGRFGWPHVGQTLTFGALIAVRRAPLVATGLGGFPLRDGHDGGPL
jgi:hypothetical protein